MKVPFVSLVLASLTACDLPTEPPAPKIPRAPDENPIVVIGERVVGAAVVIYGRRCNDVFVVDHRLRKR